MTPNPLYDNGVVLHWTRVSGVQMCIRDSSSLWGKKKIKKKDEKTGKEIEVEDYDWDKITKACLLYTSFIYSGRYDDSEKLF